VLFSLYDLYKKASKKDIQCTQDDIIALNEVDEGSEEHIQTEKSP